MSLQPTRRVCDSTASLCPNRLVPVHAVVCLLVGVFPSVSLKSRSLVVGIHPTARSTDAGRAPRCSTVRLQGRWMPRAARFWRKRSHQTDTVAAATPVPPPTAPTPLPSPSAQRVRVVPRFRSALWRHPSVLFVVAATGLVSGVYIFHEPLHELATRKSREDPSAKPQ